MRCITITAAVLLFATMSVLGADTSTRGDYYVAPGGSDDNAGTVDEPFATLARVRDAVRKRIAAGLNRKIETARVDADSVPELVALFERFKPTLVINVALPYQDLTIMDACLEYGCHYVDTANYEPPDVAKFELRVAGFLSGRRVHSGDPHSRTAPGTRRG